METGHEDGLYSAVGLAVANTEEQNYWTHIQDFVTC